MHAFFDTAVIHPQIKHHALIGIKLGIKDQRLKRLVHIAAGRRDTFHDGFQDLVHAKAGLGTYKDGVRGIQADDVLNLFLHPFRICRRQIHLVDDGNNFQVVIEGQIHVSQGLGLNALSSIDDQQCAFAGRQRPGNLVVKIHVTRGIDKIQHVFLAVLSLVNAADRLILNGNATFPFQIHGIQDLVLHLPFGQSAGHLNEPVRQGRFAVVDMSDDRKISDMAFLHVGYRAP